MGRKSDPQKIELISHLGRELSDTTIAMHEAIAKKAGLSGTDHKYLGFLIRHGAMTAGDLATHTGLTTGAVTGVIDRLEKKNLVKRTFDQTDRRKIVIVPQTKYALKVLETISSPLRNKIVGLFSQLTEKEAVIIEKHLLNTIAVMKEFTMSLQKSSTTSVKKKKST